MTDSLDPQPADLGVPDADDVRGFLSQYRYPLIVLGGLLVTAVLLSAVARRRGVLPGSVGVSTAPGPLEREVRISADWEASLRHFATAVDTRMAGMQQQLDALHAAVGTDGPALHPSAVIAPNGRSANLSYEAAIEGQDENIPPAPAATSMP